MGGFTGCSSCSSRVAWHSRPRSWADAFDFAGRGLMARRRTHEFGRGSAFHALDRRVAINLSWEWIGLGLIYLLVRNLPRTQNETSALVGIIVATAFAVSVYGLYQLTIELPLIRAEYLRNPQAILQKLGIEPGGRSEELFRNRLMGSTEIFSTFGLANSLAGYLVGPVVIALAVVFQKSGTPRRVRAKVGGAFYVGTAHSGTPRLPDADKEPQRVAGAAGGVVLLGWALAVKCRNVY